MSVAPTGSKWLKAKELGKNDVCKIIDEANWEESEYQGQKNNQYVCTVDYKGEERRLKFTVASCSEISPVYGKDSLEWIGKELKLESIKVMVGGEVKLSILATPTAVVTAPEGQKEAWDEDE